MNTSVSNLSSSAVQIRCIIDESEKNAAREHALKRAQQYVEIAGFRKGHAPLAMVEKNVDDRKLLEEIVQALLPNIMQEVQGKTTIVPIIKPSVSLESDAPLTIVITVIGRPEVKVEKPDAITIEKKEMTVSEQEVQDVIKKILKQDQEETEVDRAAANGDMIKISIQSTEKDGTPVKSLSVSNYALELGAEELLPELETHLLGMKKGDEKKVEITFANDHDIPDVQGKTLLVTLAVKSVLSIRLPELTNEYLQKRIEAEKTVETFTKDVRDMLEAQKKDTEMKRREDELYEKIQKATTVELREELIDHELQEIIEDLHQRLAKQNMTMEQWMKQMQKEPKTVVEEMKEIAKNRLILRFGIQEMTMLRKTEVSEEVLTKELEKLEQYARAQGHHVHKKDYEKDGSVATAVRLDLAVQALVQSMIAG